MDTFNNVTCYESPTSPTINGHDLKRNYKCRKGQGKDIIAYFAPFYATYYKFPDGLGGYFDIDSSTVTTNAAYDTVSVAFTVAPVKSFGGDLPPKGKSEYAISSTSIEKPIETHKNYRTHWNYNLYKFTPKGSEFMPDLPTWVNGTTKEQIEGAARDKYYIDTNTPVPMYIWTKNTPPENKYGSYNIVLLMLEPGVECYYYAARRVTETVYFNSMSQAESAIQNTNITKAPQKTYGLSSEDKYWYITNSQIHKKGKYFSCVTEYVYADNGWSKNLYG